MSFTGKPISILFADSAEVVINHVAAKPTLDLAAGGQGRMAVRASGNRFTS
ncbi:MAG TPA: hypothetical protein VJ859_10575 [Allosphingosinicella sp.]|nr:hypothetical protein [Allosphingosinicella sp.]